MKLALAVVHDMRGVVKPLLVPGERAHGFRLRPSLPLVAGADAHHFLLAVGTLHIRIARAASREVVLDAAVGRRDRRVSGRRHQDLGGESLRAGGGASGHSRSNPDPDRERGDLLLDRHAHLTIVPTSNSALAFLTV